MAAIAWRIYYADGATFTSGEPKDAPGFGVIAVCQPEPDVGLEVLHAYDFYIHLRGCWIGIIGHDALVDYLVHEAHEIEAVKAGRMIPRQAYQEIMRLALHDPDFPRKSATHQGERPR